MDLDDLLKAIAAASHRQDEITSSDHVECDIQEYMADKGYSERQSAVAAQLAIGLAWPKSDPNHEEWELDNSICSLTIFFEQLPEEERISQVGKALMAIHQLDESSAMQAASVGIEETEQRWARNRWESN